MLVVKSVSHKLKKWFNFLPTFTFRKNDGKILNGHPKRVIKQPLYYPFTGKFKANHGRLGTYVNNVFNKNHYTAFRPKNLEERFTLFLNKLGYHTINVYCYFIMCVWYLCFHVKCSCRWLYYRIYINIPAYKRDLTSWNWYKRFIFWIFCIVFLLSGCKFLPKVFILPFLLLYPFFCYFIAWCVAKLKSRRYYFPWGKPFE